jgi:hypothetical protein
MSTALGVWLAQTQTLSLVSTIVTVLGTLLVSQVPGAAVVVSGVTPTSTMSGFTSTLALPVLVMGGTTAQAAGATGQLNWLAASQTLLSVGTVATVNSILTIVTILGTQSVVVTTGTIALSGVQYYETSQSGLTTGIGVWLAPTQTIAISGVTPATTLLSGTVAFPVWMGNTLVSITGMVTISTITVTATVTATGSITVSNTGSVAISGVVSITGIMTVNTGTIVMQQSFQTAVLMIVTSTQAAAATTLLFTVYTAGTIAVAGTAQWAVPGAKNLRIMEAYIVAASSAVISVGIMKVLVSNATPTMTSTVGVLVAVPYVAAASQQFFNVTPYADATATTTVAIAVDRLATSHNIAGIIVQGYLF